MTRTPRRVTGLVALVSGVAAVLVAVPATSTAQAVLSITEPAPATTATQPGPATSGPGSVDYAYRGWKVKHVGHGFDAAYVFEPRGPRHPSAPLAVITHGYYEFGGYDQMYELIKHTVLSGNVVIYPRYQTGETTPCPGPFNVEPCMDSTVSGIRTALRFLRTHPRWTQPDLNRTSYFGFSFGGIITANLANRWKKLSLPRPSAVFLDDPEDSGLAGPGEPALDASLAGIPRSTRFECHSGADGALVTDPGGGSCNVVFARVSHIPARHKALVMTRTDDHGTPVLSSEHGVCSGSEGTADAYDWNFCWKVWDALRADAYTGRWHDYAFGGSSRHTSLGAWSDGVPVVPLIVSATALIRP